MATVKNWRGRRGLSTIEAALVLPIIIPLLLGMLEYGWLFYVQHTLTNAARQGARIGARADSFTSDIEAAITNAIAATSVADGWDYSVATESGVAFDELDTAEQFTVTVWIEGYNGLFGLAVIPVPNRLEYSVVFMKESSGA